MQLESIEGQACTTSCTVQEVVILDLFPGIQSLIACSMQIWKALKIWTCALASGRQLVGWCPMEDISCDVHPRVRGLTL